MIIVIIIQRMILLCAHTNMHRTISVKYNKHEDWRQCKNTLSIVVCVICDDFRFVSIEGVHFTKFWSFALYIWCAACCGNSSELKLASHFQFYVYENRSHGFELIRRQFYRYIIISSHKTIELVLHTTIIDHGICISKKSKRTIVAGTCVKLTLVSQTWVKLILVITALLSAMKSSRFKRFQTIFCASLLDPMRSRKGYLQVVGE